MQMFVIQWNCVERQTKLHPKLERLFHAAVNRQPVGEAQPPIRPIAYGSPEQAPSSGAWMLLVSLGHRRCTRRHTPMTMATGDGEASTCVHDGRAPCARRPPIGPHAARRRRCDSGGGCRDSPYRREERGSPRRRDSGPPASPSALRAGGRAEPLEQAERRADDLVLEGFGVDLDDVGLPGAACHKVDQRRRFDLDLAWTVTRNQRQFVEPVASRDADGSGRIRDAIAAICQSMAPPPFKSRDPPKERQTLRVRFDRQNVWPDGRESARKR